MTQTRVLRHLAGHGTRLIIHACWIAASVILIPAFADEAESASQAQALINEMSHAVRTLNYDGIFIYRRNRQIDTLRLIHKTDESGEYERLVSLSGMAREVIRNNRTVTCIFADHQQVLVEKRRPRNYIAQLPEPIERIGTHYTFSIGGEDRVAGRDARVVSIVPRDLYRYGYQLWIDKQNKMLLKSELRNKSGIPLEQIMFTQIELPADISDELLKPGFSGEGYTWYHTASAEERLSPEKGSWQVTWLPGGFTLSDHEKQSLVASGDPVDHLVFTDGLASVAVFIEKLRDPPEVNVGPASMGGINAFSKFTDGYQVTAVGEVPQATVQRMANSVVSGR